MEENIFEKYKKIRLKQKIKGCTLTKFIEFVSIKCVNGFEFSKGLLDIVGNNEETQKHIAKFMLNNKHKNKVEMKQDLFYSEIKCSDLFIDFYFSEKIGIKEECDNIIYQFYSSFSFSNKEEIIEILNSSLYLNEDEYLKNNFINQICIINGFEKANKFKYFEKLKHDLYVEYDDEAYFDNNWKSLIYNKEKEKNIIDFHIEESFIKTKSLIKNIQSNICEYFLLPDELLEYFKYLTKKGRSFIFESKNLTLSKFNNIFEKEMYTPNIQDETNIYQYVTYNKNNNAYLYDLFKITSYNRFSKNYYNLTKKLFFNFITPNDILIIKYLNKNFTHSNLAIEYFFSIYWEENGNLEIIKNNIPQEITKFNQSSLHIIHELFTPFLNILREENNIEYGFSVKRNIFDDSLFIDNNRNFYNNNLYIPYSQRKPDLSKDIENLHIIKRILGKNPSAKIIDDSITTFDNAIDLLNALYETPYSLHYKEKYGSIKNALTKNRI